MLLFFNNNNTYLLWLYFLLYFVCIYFISVTVKAIKYTFPFNDYLIIPLYGIPNFIGVKLRDQIFFYYIILGISIPTYHNRTY